MGWPSMSVDVVGHSTLRKLKDEAAILQLSRSWIDI